MPALSQKKQSDVNRLNELMQNECNYAKLRRILHINHDLIPVAPIFLEKTGEEYITASTMKEFPTIQVTCAKIILKQYPTFQNCYWMFRHIPQLRADIWDVLHKQSLTASQLTRIIIQCAGQRQSAWEELIARKDHRYYRDDVKKACRKIMKACPEYRKQAAEMLIYTENKDIVALKHIADEYPDLDFKAMKKICGIAKPKNKNCWIVDRFTRYDKETAFEFIDQIISPVLLFAIMQTNEHLRTYIAKILLKKYRSELSKRSAYQDPVFYSSRDAIFWIAKHIPELAEEATIIVLDSGRSPCSSHETKDMLNSLPQATRERLITQYPKLLNHCKIVACSIFK